MRAYDFSLLFMMAVAIAIGIVTAAAYVWAMISLTIRAWALHPAVGVFVTIFLILFTFSGTVILLELGRDT